MKSLTIPVRGPSLLVLGLCLCIAWIGNCDDEVFIDIHITVDDPVLSQALSINAWAFGEIPGASSFTCSISIL
jgi:hypothetical protein